MVSDAAAKRAEFSDLPGWELVSRGLADAEMGRNTVAAMLVRSAADRLAAIGLVVPGEAVADAHLQMYALLEAEVGEARAHSRYNALRRRLLSFLRAAPYATGG
ncbi:MAG: hypothetical protein M3N29_09720 [Chloroflexota bacterium]|nr:hypothetical protein [Chloroflexota bacterium]